MLLPKLSTATTVCTTAMTQVHGLDGTGAFAKRAQNILSVTDGGHDWLGWFLSLAKRLQKLYLVRVQNFERVWVYPLLRMVKYPSIGNGYRYDSQNSGSAKKN